LSFRRPSLLPNRDPRGQEAQDVLVQPQLPLEFLDRRGLGGHLQDGVRPLTLLADVVRQTALPPVFQLDDLGPERLDLVGKLREQRGDFLVAGTSVDDEKNFVRPQNESPPRASGFQNRSA
jgi:hypothetical protein